MLRWLLSSLAGMGFVALTAPPEARADDDAPTVTFTARVQILQVEADYFTEGGGDFVNYGGTARFNAGTDSRGRARSWVIDGIFGEEGDTSQFVLGNFAASRVDIGAYREVTNQNNFTTIMGARYINFESTEGNTVIQIDNVTDSYLLGAGARYSSQAAVGSPHNFSAQAIVYAGYYDYAPVRRERSGGGVVTSRPLSEEASSGFALTTEAAVGYAFFLTRNFGVGARLRGYIPLTGDDAAIFGPEVNLSVAF